MSKAKRKQAADAADRAERAANAAKQLAEQAKRSAEAHETQARLAEAKLTAKEQSPWVIESIPGAPNCLLRNKTDTSKYCVTATGEAVRGFVDTDDDVVPVIERGDTVELDVIRVLQPIDQRVTVGWYRDGDCQGEQMSKAYQLPPGGN
ncbi:hypothetical protein B586_03385 [Mycobacterium haemophilum DSM 44634]|uniref:hypothetical protein n=1 Tax=Mycobacterium haemophilum TaxID=29311 RepID=UPI00065629FA|nr:hypothetical protein [Mycobacterium haemophilum]AKN15820.1 hypothetical protein B586_03385 [Mycobacterium haemophilum DSM 44634]MCV7341065.1 hypothetical protein [Mycobacterium haemophilum DSM 44634]